MTALPYLWFCRNICFKLVPKQTELVSSKRPWVNIWSEKSQRTIWPCRARKWWFLLWQTKKMSRIYASGIFPGNVGVFWVRNGSGLPSGHQIANSYGQPDACGRLKQWASQRHKDYNLKKEDENNWKMNLPETTSPSPHPSFLMSSTSTVPLQSPATTTAPVWNQHRLRRLTPKCHESVVFLV